MSWIDRLFGIKPFEFPKTETPLQAIFREQREREELAEFQKKFNLDQGTIDDGNRLRTRLSRPSK